MLIQSILLNNRVQESLQLMSCCSVGLNPGWSISCSPKGLSLWIPTSIDENHQWDPGGFSINFHLSDIG